MSKTTVHKHTVLGIAKIQNVHFEGNAMQNICKSKFKNCGATNKITFKMIRCLIVSVILPIVLIVKN